MSKQAFHQFVADVTTQIAGRAPVHYLLPEGQIQFTKNP